jgi:hypothetical protein
MNDHEDTEDLVVITTVDNVGSTLNRIAQREKIEQDRIFNIIGMAPIEEELPGPNVEVLSNSKTPEQLSTNLQISKGEISSSSSNKKEKEPITPNDQKSTKDSSTTIKEKIKMSKTTQPPKVKKQTKKDLPEAVKNRLSNNAALREIGGPVKSWMLPPSNMPSSSGIKPSKLTSTNSISNSSGMGFKRTTANKRIILKDALFAMENTRVLKNSRLIYKWYASVK